MKRWVPVAVILVLVALAVVWMTSRKKNEKGKDGEPVAATATKKAAPGRGGSAPMIAPFSREADADGTLRLEGLVVDEAGAPVPGAKVWVSSEPKRDTTGEDDGSFAFDKLLGRTYYLTAQAGELVGSASHLLSDKSPPVTIVVKQGSTIVVTVTSDAGPVAGAQVKLAAQSEHEQTTGADGKATIKGVSDGWTALKVRAEGFAAHAEFVEVSRGTKEIAVRLKKGAPVTGRVIDEAGKPVQDAKIYAIDASSFYGEIDSEPLAQSDAKGEFSIAAVAPGSYRFRARHKEFATTTSAIIQVDDRGPRTPIILTMAAGITVAGRVVNAAKEVVPYANVKLDARGAEGRRQTTASADGLFEFKAVVVGEQLDALSKMSLYAWSETAASSVVTLAAASPAASGKQDITGIELILDLVGTISGVTVDESGAVVPEATVTASLDPVKSNPSLGDLAWQSSTAISDGDGRFELHGLADAEYLLMASRGGMAQDGGWLNWAPDSPTVKAGATNVKVTVPGEGKVVGKVAYADGSAPTTGTARLGWQHNAMLVNGAFEIDHVPAGNYALRIRGNGFTEGAKDDVKVKSGETVDVGTIVVERGRTLSGVVRDASGKAVAGAMVYVGEMIIASGTGIADAGAAVGGEMRGVRSGETGADGSFSIGGVGPKATNVVAESTSGRSFVESIPAGTTDVGGLAIVLRAYGSLSGIVTSQGKPMAAQIIAGAQGEIRSISVVNSGEDGMFIIERLPQGEYRVTAQTGGGMGTASGTASAKIVAGKKTDITVDIPVGDIELTVEVKGEGGAKIDAAQIFVFRGTVAAKTGKELGDVFGKADGASMQFWLGGVFPKFSKMLAGTHTVCTIPINGDMRDQAFMQRLNEHANELAVHCAAYAVTDAPKQQTFTHTVPPMKPLQ